MAEFFEVVSLQVALDRATRFGPVGTERLGLTELAHRVLAEDVVAAADAPAFVRATMDGFAVRASSTFGATEANPALLAVVGSVPMGEPSGLTIGVGQAARIGTGGMVPEGADAVVMIEHTEPLDEGSIEVTRSVAPGQHLVARGDDWRADQVLIQAGARLRPQEIGLLAALGRTEAQVFARPRVAIVSTGDEVVPVDAEPGHGQIRDVNSHTLAAGVQQSGGVPELLGIVADQFEALLATSKRALARADVVLLSGGSSVGARDFTLETIRALADSEVLVHGISIKPGKPTIVARVGDKAFFGLPGHVTSAMVVFEVLIRPVLRRLAGQREPATAWPRARARLSRQVSSVHGRVDYVRVQLREQDGMLWADPLLGPSGLLRTMVQADGLVEIGLNAEGLDEGSEIWVTPL